ncbi:MAG TPA: adenylate/guanylate cyclase domain-containing protein [Nocardioidaceae bacterium]|nr:adenylate/guanylate cyclase domain-containing protein [Nocardioidaceae bacterium]
MERPDTRFARNGDVHIAYQVVGDGPMDLVWVPSLWSHVELQWENDLIAATLNRLAGFSRLITYDKRGTGLSDRSTPAAAYEEHVSDLVAVLDAAGSQSSALFGYVDGGIIALLFAAAYPERARALVTFGTAPRLLPSPDYAQGTDPVVWRGLMRQLDDGNVEPFLRLATDDPEALAWGVRHARASISPAEAVAALKANVATDIRSILPVINTPVLVTHLANDRFVSPDNARYLAEHLPSAELLLLDGNDYTAMWRDEALDELETFVTGVRPDPRVDRVLATVLFMDVVGSTEHAARLGDNEWGRQLDRFEGIVRRVLERFRGTLVSTAGDGFLATFDGPARAVRCAQTVQESLRAIELATRAGVHTGEIEVRGADVAGLAVHVASRVMSAADPEEILVSRTVTDLVAGSGLEFEERGEHELKGVPGRWPLFAVKR